MLKSKELLKNLYRIVKERVIPIVQYTSIYYLVTRYAFEIGVCHGVSMEPTLNERDYLFIMKIRRYDIKRNDIVILKSPFNPDAHICKRVIYLPGDVFTQGKDVVKLGQGQVWLEGDNLEESSDSREYGAVPIALIMGKITYKLWPKFENLKS